MNIPDDLLLIETMAWEKDPDGTGRFRLLKEHMERLKGSASFFGFPFSKNEFLKRLHKAQEDFRKNAQDIMRVRVTLDRSGQLEVTYSGLCSQIKTPVLVDISQQKVKSSDPFLYHKTTKRDLFDLERKRLDAAGLFETIFLNERNELTQGTITNLFLDSGGDRLLTPALSSGLLPGTLRRHLLEKGQAEEAVLKVHDLLNAKKIFLGNSVRGLVEAVVAGDSHGSFFPRK